MGMRGIVTRPGSLVPGPPLTSPMPPMITGPAGLTEAATNSAFAAGGETAAHVGADDRVGENGGGGGGGGTWARAKTTLASRSKGTIVGLRALLGNRQGLMVGRHCSANCPLSPSPNRMAGGALRALRRRCKRQLRVLSAWRGSAFRANPHQNGRDFRPARFHILAYIHWHTRPQNVRYPLAIKSAPEPAPRSEVQ
jgi:hypothetical protein